MEVAGKQLTVREFVESGRRCDTPIPTDNQMRRARLAAEAVRRVAGVEDSLNPSNKVTIRVAFHVIHKGNEGKVSRARIDQQINVLNKEFRTFGFNFALAGDPDYTDVDADADRADWYTMGHLSAEEREAKTTLGKDPERFLNLYTANLGDGLLGWATFPSDLAADVDMDGVVILHTSLPAEDGSANPAGGTFGLGQTATHEVGHWVGLFHTFQGGCVPPDDDVKDTPPHQVNFGCPSPVPDSCSGDMDPSDSTKPWLDPVHNFMNYTDDACMSEFTSGQIRRTREQTTTFRPKLYDIPSTLRADIRRAARAAGR